MQNVQKIVDEFLNFLSIEKNYRQRTIKEYRLDIAIFREFLGFKSIVAVDKMDIRSFMAFLKEQRNYSTNGILRKLASLRSFYNFCLKEGYVLASPVGLVQSPKQGRKLPIYLTDEEVMKIMNVVKSENYTLKGKQDLAIVALFLGTGFRISELVSIRFSDIERSHIDHNSEVKMTIKVLGKGNKERIVPLDGFAKKALQEWVDQRPISEHDFVFISLSSLKPMNVRTVQRHVKKYAVSAGINKPITPHKLRHTFATNLMRNGANIVAIQNMLGHVSLETTKIYTHLNQEDHHKAVAKLSYN